MIKYLSEQLAEVENNTIGLTTTQWSNWFNELVFFVNIVGAVLHNCPSTLCSIHYHSNMCPSLSSNWLAPTPMPLPLGGMLTLMLQLVKIVDVLKCVSIRQRLSTWMVVRDSGNLNPSFATNLPCAGVKVT